MYYDCYFYSRVKEHYLAPAARQRVIDALVLVGLLSALYGAYRLLIAGWLIFVGGMFWYGREMSGSRLQPREADDGKKALMAHLAAGIGCCVARCHRQHSGVRRKAVILMALGAAIFVGFGIAGPGYLGIAGWLIFVGGMFWYGRETLRRD
jgi:hypothetical protein